MKKKILAFTLAEVLICLTIIGILTALLIPQVKKSTDNTNVVKFQKANTVLIETMNSLVNDGAKYMTGDLAHKPDGTDASEINYFCNSLSDELSIKSVSCKNTTTLTDTSIDVTTTNLAEVLDTKCKATSSSDSSTITTKDGILFIELAPYAFSNDAFRTLASSDSSKYSSLLPSEYVNCKILCIDIDGIPSGGSASCDDKTDICPFGYGIRVDGKILPGARASEWLLKTTKSE